MTLIDDDLKSCDPQLLTQPPNPQWGVEDLGSYAQAQNQAICGADQSLTVSYWRLGLALNLARKHFAHQQWGRYLKELKIEKTRAARARAIQDSFNTEQQVAELTVQEAYGRRSRKVYRPSTDEPRPVQVPVPKLDLVEFLVGVCKQADLFSGHVENTIPEQAPTILSAIDETIAELGKLRTLFSQRLQA